MSVFRALPSTTSPQASMLDWSAAGGFGTVNSAEPHPELMQPSNQPNWFILRSIILLKVSAVASRMYRCVALELFSLGLSQPWPHHVDAGLGCFPQRSTQHVVFVTFKDCIPPCSYLVSVDLIPTFDDRHYAKQFAKCSMWSLVLCNFIPNLLVALSREEAQLSWLLRGIPPMKRVHEHPQLSQSTSSIGGHLCLLCCVSA